MPPDAPLAVDGTVQRFELAFELAWKTLRDALADEGLDETPRDALRQSFGVGWIDDEAAWLQMLRDRNAASHVYSEEVAAEIYGRIGGHARALRQSHDALRARLAE